MHESRPTIFLMCPNQSGSCCNPHQSLYQPTLCLVYICLSPPALETVPISLYSEPTLCSCCVTSTFTLCANRTFFFPPRPAHCCYVVSAPSIGPNRRPAGVTGTSSLRNRMKKQVVNYLDPSLIQSRVMDNVPVHEQLMTLS